MPVVVEPDPAALPALLAGMPPGSHAVGSPEQLHAWLDQHHEEFVVVLGPGLSLEASLDTLETLRTSRPTLSGIVAREALDTQVLARAMKAGARDVVAQGDTEALVEAVARAHELHVALRGPGVVRQPGRVITVFSPKGGVGKTTLAVNLALALAERGARKVCLVDLDLAFGDVAITLQLFPTHSIEHAIGSEEGLDAPLLEGLMTRHPASLTVLAAPSQPDARERITPLLVSRVLRTLREEYDHVVVDSTPAFDEQTLTALDETDECVLVATLDVPTLKNVKVALETLDMLSVAPGHRHLVLNRADDQVGLGPEKVEAILGLPVSARISTAVEIAAATNAGTPIVLDKPEHPSSLAIRALAAGLAGEPALPAPSTDPTSGAADPARPARRFKLRR